MTGAVPRKRVPRRRVPRKRKFRWFVATYGPLGIDVEFYSNQRWYDRAVRMAERRHAECRIDTWTAGDIS